VSKPTATSVLQIHLPERWPDALGEPPLRWTLRREAAVEDGVSRPADVPRADETVIVLPVTRVAFMRAALPRGPTVKLAKLAPFAIEDAIVSAPEQVQCAVFGEDGRGDEERLIAVLDREWLGSALAELEAFGIRPDRAIVESALVAQGEDTWTVVWSGNGGFAALGGVEAIALDASVDGRPPLALKLAMDERRHAGNAPREVRVLTAGAADPPATAKWAESLHVPVTTAGKWLPETADARAAACADLLPGAGTGAWVGAGWLARLKPAAALIATIVAAHLLVTVGDWARLAYEARSLRKEMETAFRTAFPEASAVVDPVLQMRRNVADLRRAAGEPDATDLVPLLARLVPALAAAGARPQSLRYRRSELEFELAVGSGETRERLASRLHVPGMRVRIERVTTDGGEPVATVRIAVEGA
jgi:general secretion pathway protein L